MPTNKNKLKVRMIRTPEYENESTFIVIDRLLPEFDTKHANYLLGCQLYTNTVGIGPSRRMGEKMKSDLILRGNDDESVYRSRTDVFELPTLREYIKFMDLLKENGYCWNKRKDIITKNGRLIV